MTYTPYLAPSEYAAFGVAGVSGADLTRACLAVDGILGRAQGILWTADRDGVPAYMTNASPVASFTLADAITPGASVTALAAGVSFVNVGSVVTLDRAGQVESCSVTAINGDTITLDRVKYAHAAGSTAEFGLTGIETVRGRASLRRTIPVVRTFPAITLPDTDRFYANRYAPYELLGDPTCTHEPAFYQRHVISGWKQNAIPAAIKQAVANLVTAGAEVADSGMGANVKLLKAGDATIERFAPGLIDSATEALLAPYREYRL